MLRSVFSRHRFQALAIVSCLTAAVGCGGNIGPTTTTTQQQPVVPKSLTIQGSFAGTVGEAIPLSALLTLSDDSTQAVTATATWTTSNQAVATISASGLLTLVAAGECDITASYTQASSNTTVKATVPVTAAARVAQSFTLFGVATDSVSGRAVVRADVRVVGGVNASRATTTDDNGYFSIPLVAETVTLRFSKDGYETLETSVPLTADLRRDVQMKPLPPPPFTGTYNVTLTTTTNGCSDITPGSSGTLSLSGTALNLTITMTERGITRIYRGSMDGAGNFTGGGSGVTNVQPHEFTGTISGRVQNNFSVSGTEGLRITLGCPGGVANISTNFAGTK